MVMTMPDLDRYQIKRSKYPVHYVYVHHSLVSSHMAYRPGAFDHFDTVFCAGPHHARELREQERVYDLAPKILVEHGYGRLDTILAESPPPLSHSGRSLNVLIAPSWGEHGIVEAIGHELIGVLLDRGFRVTLRPHPQTVRFSKEPLKKIAEHYAKVDSFELETDVSSTTSLLESDLMITDWSGSAFDYAFGLERPVLFMDVPPKVNNPKYTDVALEPFESSSRSEIGVICAPDSLSTVPDRIEDLLKQSESWREKIRSYRAESVFNVGSSALAGAKWLADRLKANDGAPEA
jgi:YidC/Oxa1 family membrane protein insertase